MIVREDVLRHILRQEFFHLKEFFMQQFDDLTTAVNTLIAADEAENTLLATISSQLNAILANPQGVDPQAVSDLRDKVNAELVKVNAAVVAAGGTAIPPNPGNLPTPPAPAAPPVA
jgi:hypothetical protein